MSLIYKILHLPTNTYVKSYSYGVVRNPKGRSYTRYYDVIQAFQEVKNSVKRRGLEQIDEYVVDVLELKTIEQIVHQKLELDYEISKNKSDLKQKERDLALSVQKLKYTKEQVKENSKHIPILRDKIKELKTKLK